MRSSLTTGMEDITVENWWKIGFSNTRLLVAAALICFSSSMEYELDALEPGARYGELESSARWRMGKDESGRAVVVSMEIDVKVDVPDGLRSEFAEVVKEHEGHACSIVRSLRRGIPVKVNISET
ncbi:OsmC family protein [Candidatus Bathyarchaeota archaeon]|nr:OsmC family protein [Candidatus Bathyarchaeota archaeon]MBL7167781.1 OsmC family protein [Candidatus Bathyarchaeota archaeon]